MLADTIHLTKINKNAKLALIDSIFLIYSRFVVRIVFFEYSLDELRFRETGTKTRQLINMKCSANECKLRPFLLLDFH